MKLKRLFLAAGVALMAMGASAQTNPEDVRIYINPGHGSWGPNNRHCATIGHSPISSENPDTTDFFESNTNLRKCLALLGKLAEYGMPFDHTKNQTNSNPNRIGAALDLSQNIVMSHVKCGPYPYDNTKDETLGYIPDDQKNDFNRTLSEIAAEVEANNFDMFISVHSNASDDGNTVNYLYFAYDDDYTGNDKTLSIEMSRCGWNHRILDRHTKWTHYDYTMTAADVAAGKGKIGYQGLGVLNHSVSGYLVEGYFHTYQPARHRAMNFDVDRIEGIDYARGVADYFGWEKESYGAIYGIVRDRHTKFSVEGLYTPNAATNDIYKPLNDVIVTLKKDGVKVAEDTTDVNYNGAWVFQGLEPGEYTVEFSHPDYKSDIYANTYATTKPAPLTVTVAAAKTAYPEAFLESTSYISPAVVYVNYPDSLAGKNFALAEEYNLKGTEINLLASQLEGKKVRRQIIRDGKLYVLALDEANEPYIYLADLANNTVITLDTKAVAMGANGKLKISDIVLTADNYLVANGMSGNHYSDADASNRGEERGSVNVYKWNKNEETGLPETCNLWFSTQTTSNMTYAIVGRTIAYSGSTIDGSLTITSEHGTKTSSIALRMERLKISDDQYIGDERLDSWATNYNETINCYFYTDNLSSSQDYELMVSPRGTEEKVIYFIDGNKIAPMEFYFEVTGAKNPATIERNETYVNAAVNGANYFKYAGRDLMVAPKNEAGKICGVKLYDITDGISKAKEIETNITIEPVDYTYASAHGELALTIDPVSGYTTKAEIELFLVVDGKVTKFTTAGVKQPVYSGVYAYNLAMTQSDAQYSLSFNLNDKSSSVDVVLVPTNEDEEEIVYSLGALEAGAHTCDVDASTISGEYTWKVVVANKTITSGEIIATMNTWGASSSTYYRGGIAVETNPESDNFATTYLGVARSKGVFLLDPMYQVKEGAPYWVGKFNTGNASSTFRAALYNDKFYLTDWSDAYPGIWIFDPANPTAINNIFAGATNDGTGKLTIDGVAVGGGSTGVAFTGSGDSRKMFIYVEDLPTGNGGNKLYRYDIGANDTWGAKEPVQLSTASAKLANTNTGMLGSALHNVVFCSQTRYSGSNQAGVPAFIVIDEEGGIIFNSADLAETLDGCQGGGMALNADETKFAIVDGSAAIQVYDVEWTDNVPSFTHYCSIATNDQEISQMAFDYSGNLHCINRKHGYYVHAVPCEARDVETPAKSTLLIKGTLVSIESVEMVEDANVAPIYYNLQGVQVTNPENGIYIVKRGNKITKEYIRK